MPDASGSVRTMCAMRYVRKEREGADDSAPSRLVIGLDRHVYVLFEELVDEIDLSASCDLGCGGDDDGAVGLVNGLLLYLEEAFLHASLRGLVVVGASLAEVSFGS